MNIKRCDRCGEEIRYNGNWLDLCPACEKSLRTWMSEGHPEKHQEKNPPKVRKAYIIPEPEMPNVEDLKFGD